MNDTHDPDDDTLEVPPPPDEVLPDEAIGYQLLPTLDDERYAKLARSIREKGVRQPVVFDEDGTIIDGHHRLAIVEHYNLPVAKEPDVIVLDDFEDESEKLAEAIEENLNRRQTSEDDKREAVRRYIERAWPVDEERGAIGQIETQQEVADKLGVSRGLVAQVFQNVNRNILKNARLKTRQLYEDSNGRLGPSDIAPKVDASVASVSRWLTEDFDDYGDSEDDEQTDLVDDVETSPPSEPDTSPPDPDPHEGLPDGAPPSEPPTFEARPETDSTSPVSDGAEELAHDGGTTSAEAGSSASNDDAPSRGDSSSASETEPGKGSSSDEDDGPSTHVAANSGNNDWHTPPEYIGAAREVMGAIDLDPASSPVANDHVEAERFYTKGDDGLEQPWSGRIWLNPPYEAGLVDKFAEKARASVESGDVEQAIVLVNNATETRWFQGLVEVADRLCFPKGRISYLTPEGEPKNNPVQGQVFLYFGDREERFEDVFEQFGFVVSIRRTHDGSD